ncbi:MAG: DUF4097 family beta strand repeat-containing protein, partial [Longimicrobiales bacterium]
MWTLLLVGAVAAPGVARQQTDTTFAVQPDGRMRIECNQGSVRLRSWDRSSMRIVASHSSRVRVTIRRSQGLLRVASESRQGGQETVDYEITLPRPFGVRVDGHHCDALIQDIEGDFTIDNVQGDVVIRNIRGDVDVESVEGEIIASDVRGRIRAETVNQGIRISGAAGNVDAESVNGPIQLSGVVSDSVAAESVNGNIQFQGELRNGARYNMSTHNGNIQLVVPAGTNARVMIATHSGSVETDFPVQLRESTAGGRLTIQLGSGGARIDLESFGGTIRLIRPGGRSPDARDRGRLE